MYKTGTISMLQYITERRWFYSGARLCTEDHLRTSSTSEAGKSPYSLNSVCAILNPTKKMLQYQAARKGVELVKTSTHAKSYKLYIYINTEVTSYVRQK